MELAEEVFQIGKLPVVIGAAIADVDDEVDVATRVVEVLQSFRQGVGGAGEDLSVYVARFQQFDDVYQPRILEGFTAQQANVPDLALEMVKELLYLLQRQDLVDVVGRFQYLPCETEWTAAFAFVC